MPKAKCDDIWGLIAVSALAAELPFGKHKKKDELSVLQEYGSHRHLHKLHQQSGH
jgi:hypothetical protein